MADYNIVTGYTGQSHITAQNDRDRNIGTFSDTSFVLPIGAELEAEITSSTTVTLSDGVFVCQGMQGEIISGATVELDFTAGNSGYYRKDYICAVYALDSDTTYESVDFAIIEGESSTSAEYTEPDYTTGTIRDGATTVYFPLWAIKFTGTTAELERIAPVKNEIIWYHTNGYSLTGSQTISLGNSLTPNGYSLVWCRYSSSSGLSLSTMSIQYIPSATIVQMSATLGSSNQTYLHPCFSNSFAYLASKYVKVYQSEGVYYITGTDDNKASGTANSVTYDNSSWRLVYVIGV